MAYCAQSDVEAMFGRTNVYKWADMDNGASAVDIAARVTSSIAQADAEIDALLLGGPYTVPFTGTIPPLIVQTSAALAGCCLYMARGSSDIDDQTGEPINRLYGVRSMNIARLRGIRAGMYRLSTTETATRYPAVENVETFRDEQTTIGSP